MNRKGVAAIYVGDIGDIFTVHVPVTPIADNIDIDSLSTRDMFKLALAHNIDVRLLLGVDNCYEHVGMLEMGARALPDGYNWAEDTNYCNNCWLWFRRK